jgi:SNF2 family DNA or RNA helicase
VFDEAHKLRGRGYKEKIENEDGSTTIKQHERSLQASAAYNLRYNAVFLITGTPQVRDLGDWFALLSMIDRKKFSSYWQFVTEYAKLKHTPWGDKVGKVKDRATFRELITPYILRRDYKGVGLEMPDAVQEEIYLYPPADFMQKYRAIRNSYRVQQSDGTTRYLLSAGALQSELYKLVSNLREKLDALRAFCRDNRETQIVIWCWRRDTVDAVIKHLSTDESWGIFRITGSIPQQERRHTVEQFKSTKNGILVATISSLGLGENIQTAHLTVFYERSYLPSDNEQAIARLRRLGQQETVIVKQLLVESTVDTATYRAQSKRGEEIDSIFLNELYKDD